MNFHEWTNDAGEVLILKRIPKDRKTNGGFLWPKGVGTLVECPDWNPKPECGGGLHGWPCGFSLGDGQDYDIIGDSWLVLGAKPNEVVLIEKSAKVKAKSVVIRFEGSFLDAVRFVTPGFSKCIKEWSKTTGYYGKSAVAGDSGKSAVAGDSGKSAVAGGYGQSAVAGDYGKSAVAGDYGQSAVAGYYGKSAVAGDYGKSAVAGDSGKSAVAGDYGSAEVKGKDGVAAIAGTGRVRVGERGAFAIAYHTNTDGWRFLTGKVGENGIQADTWYVIQDGKLCEEK